MFDLRCGSDVLVSSKTRILELEPLLQSKGLLRPLRQPSESDYSAQFRYRRTVMNQFSLLKSRLATGLLLGRNRFKTF